MSDSSDRIRNVRDVVRSIAPEAARVCIAVCAPPARIASITRAMLRMGSFRPPPEAAPRAPVPHALAIMPLDDGLDLEVLGVPLDETFAPMWPLALCRANSVVRLEPCAALDEACAVIGVAAHDVAQLAPTFAEDDEDEVATLLRAAAEHARV
ncbi:MAG TPA: hypothetical protein VGH28_29585 [Polyangiaceae bacterium]